ncbi:MAG TPA: alpha/beta hydrolase [Anaerolineae bacterium]|nr:alpha/beta hydrolase [Anaerolineae bacterium]
MLLAVLPVIDWSFRYYALAALLLLLAVLGAISLLRKKEEEHAYSAARVAVRGAGMTALIFVVTLPAIIFPQYSPLEPTGQYRVATASYTYTDTNRIETYTNTGDYRKLNVELWYPDDAGGTYPLIVFSHGSLGTKTSNETLYTELASHGYVVCSIDHTYQCFFTTGEDGHTAFLNPDFMQELMAELNGSDRQFSHACYQKWMGIRMGDIDCVLDHILSEARDSAADRAYRLVDTARIGVMGHSLGGSAALGIGRARPDIGAVMALESPFMYDIEGVENGEFAFTDAPYPVPVLNVYSDDSWGHLGEWPQYAENHALLAGTNPAAFNVHIGGVGHLSLTDLSLASPILTRLLNGHASTTGAADCLEAINRACLRFFDCYLKGQGTFSSAGTY